MATQQQQGSNKTAARKPNWRRATKPSWDTVKLAREDFLKRNTMSKSSYNEQMKELKAAGYNPEYVVNALKQYLDGPLGKGSAGKDGTQLTAFCADPSIIGQAEAAGIEPFLAPVQQTDDDASFHNAFCLEGPDDVDEFFAAEE